MDKAMKNLWNDKSEEGKNQLFGVLVKFAPVPFCRYKSHMGCQEAVRQVAVLLQACHLKISHVSENP
jgi:hypothetical protein